jgi:hypothetical protein
VKDFYIENYKTLKNKIKEDSRSGKSSHVHGLTELVLGK